MGAGRLRKFGVNFPVAGIQKGIGSPEHLMGYCNCKRICLQLTISTGRTTEKYLTERESKVLIEQVQYLLNEGAFSRALMNLIGTVE